MARVVCKLCAQRAARRFCAGEKGDICAICCGTEREVSISCPLDCEYLIEARRHEKPVPFEGQDLPNADIQISDNFLREHDRLVGATGHLLLKAAVETPDAIDQDVQEALEALIRTCRTLDSGLIYQTRPQNPIAASIQARFQAGLDELRKSAAEQTGLHNIRDRDVLGVLVFWERMGLQWNNGRRRGRMFISALATLSAPPVRGEVA